MDNDTNKFLEGEAAKINKLLTELDSEFNDIGNKDDDFSQIEIKLKDIDIKLQSMMIQKDDLKEEININFWGNKREELKSKYKDFIKKYENLTKNKKKENKDPENIDISFDHTKATIEEEYKRGKKILKEDDKILGDLIDIVSKDGKTLMIVKQKLRDQKEQLDMLPFDEMEYSLKRTGVKIRNMMKMALQDNIAKCLIFVISITILTIIIVSFCKEKKDNNYNLPFDIFSSNKNGINKDNNTTSSDAYSFCLANKFYYTILIIVILFL